MLAKRVWVDLALFVKSKEVMVWPIWPALQALSASEFSAEEQRGLGFRLQHVPFHHTNFFPLCWKKGRL